MTTTRLRPVSDLPDIYRSLFKFGVFNAVQSQCFDTVMHSDENMVISAPTGSGKTVLFELAIVKMLRETSGSGQKVKCVYIAPTKSLCTEKASDWQAKFAMFGAKCSELTGDTVNTGRGVWGDAKDATIIVTTGEKWDSLTRHWQDHSHILSQIHLFLIDEVHLLNETRGSTLEVVVSRMKLRGSSVRFMVVSATVPNIEDVAEWIGNHGQNGPAIVKQFGDEFRPCKLSRFVYGIPRRRDTNDFVFAKALDYKLYGILQQHCNNQPVLVFCPTRKGVMAAAEHILKEYEEAMGKKSSLPWSKPPRIDHGFSNKQLDKLAAYGIGVHHAGLGRDDRSATEQLYLKKVLKVLFATSTLAVGVNLPAHTVIIKGVKLYLNNASQEYSDLDIMQMIGRAGRPQFDKEGVAVIMCEQELEAKYKALAQGQTVLESSLHLSLAEHLNSEIALGTITDMETAKEWLHNSFLYRRLQKNPGHYDVKKEGNRTWEERMDDLVTHSVLALQQAQMVDQDNDNVLSSTDYGDIMSKFYVRQATMVQIIKLSDTATVREILEALSCSEEFSDIKFRSGEKQVYNKLRTHHDIRYTLKKIEKPSDKVFILIQAILGAINLSDPEYKTAETQPYIESIPILRHICRIARAIVEVANARKAGLLLKNALEVLRCLSAKAWEDRSVVFRQLDDIGLKSLKVLAEHKITTFAALMKTDPSVIETLLNRKPPFGHDILVAVKQLPQCTVDLSEINVTTREEGVDVELAIECSLLRDIKSQHSRKSKKHKRHDMTMVLTLTSDNNFVDFRRISTSALKESRTFEITTRLTKPSQSIVVLVTSDTYAGLTVSASYKPRVDSSAFPVMDTRPQDAMARDLDGLEDVADFWDVGDDGNFKSDEGSKHYAPAEITSHVNTQVKPQVKAEVPSWAGESQSVLADSVNTAPKQLPNGNFECNHTCKDKTKCKHFCCRDGLAKPPPMTKRRLEQIIASHLLSGNSQTPASSSSNKAKPRPKTTENSKVDAERGPMKQLEALHKRTGVKENLQLGDKSRIKLDDDLRDNGKRPRRPMPDFDIEFTPLNDKLKEPPVDVSAMLSDSDDDMPDAQDILDSLGGSETGRPAAASDPTDYADPELDTLIAQLPNIGDTAKSSSTETPMVMKPETSIVSRKRRAQSPKSPRPRKRVNAGGDESPIEILSSPEGGGKRSTIFYSSFSDEGDMSKQLFHPMSQSSPSTSPVQTRSNDGGGFVLDDTLFDIIPSTQTLTEASYPRSSKALDIGRPRLRSEVGRQGAHDPPMQRSQKAHPKPRQEVEHQQTEDEAYDNPLAEFEAWLQSGAVDIAEQ
ncbi:Sec63 Brl domain-containing protein [Daedaleopsis nitida]|nr:Sec63 Brl domain-containing protein [Daedaleopsis nitida]